LGVRNLTKNVSHMKFHSVPAIPRRILREHPRGFLRAWAFTSLLCQCTISLTLWKHTQVRLIVFFI
jgi:hypothetical protein